MEPRRLYVSYSHRHGFGAVDMNFIGPVNGDAVMLIRERIASEIGIPVNDIVVLSWQFLEE
jgi:hypothetical protein